MKAFTLHHPQKGKTMIVMARSFERLKERIQGWPADPSILSMRLGPSTMNYGADWDFIVHGPHMLPKRMHLQLSGDKLVLS